MMEPIYERTLRINGFECDFNQRWKPASFFQQLTETAGIHAMHLGVGYEVMVAQHLLWVHARMKIKFFDFPRVGEQITIRTWPKTIQQRLFYIRDFEVWDVGGKQLAAATSAWLVIHAATRRMVPPQAFDMHLPDLPERAGLDEPLEKLAVPEEGEERLRLQAGYSAVDMLGHVNNSRYVEWICDCFPHEYYQQNCLDWVQVNYDREVLPGEQVAVLGRQDEQDPALWKLAGMNRTRNTRAFEAALHWKAVDA